MGKILEESHLYTGGAIQEVADRTNEVIIVKDCHDLEGYGVYVCYPFSDTDSFTTSFGYGAMSHLMACDFFQSVSNYFEAVLSALPAETNLAEVEFGDEFRDDWFNLVMVRAEDGTPTHEIDPSMSHMDGTDDMLRFIAKWREPDTALTP